MELDPAGDDEAVEEEEEPAPDDGEEWKKIEKEEDFEVRQLTLVEIVKTRGEALEAVAKMTTKLRYHGLPVRRLHSDRAGEFTSKRAKKWAMERLIMRTFTDGSSWKMNGRAEAEVGFIKRLTKTLLKGSGVEENLWPLAARHAGERRWRSQLEAMNYPVKPLRAFGSMAMAKTKADVTMSASSGGYFVQGELLPHHGCDAACALEDREWEPDLHEDLGDGMSGPGEAHDGRGMASRRGTRRGPRYTIW